MPELPPINSATRQKEGNKQLLGTKKPTPPSSSPRAPATASQKTKSLASPSKERRHSSIVPKNSIDELEENTGLPPGITQAMMQMAVPKKRYPALMSLLKEEEDKRIELETASNSETASIILSFQQPLFMSLSGGNINGLHAAALSHLVQSAERQEAASARTHAMNRAIWHSVTTTGTVLKSFVEYRAMEVQRRLEDACIQNGVLRQMLAERENEIVRLFADIDGLRDSLARIRIRTDLEKEEERRKIEAAIERNRADVDGMRRQLQLRLDETILALCSQGNQLATAPVGTAARELADGGYASKLRDLEGLVSNERFKLQRQTDELRYIIDSIGAESRFEPKQLSNQNDLGDGRDNTGDRINSLLIAKDETRRDDSATPMPLHTNLPRAYRERLARCSRAALLRLLDAASFAPGAVPAIGHALYEMGQEQQARSEKRAALQEKIMLNQQTRNDGNNTANSEEETHRQIMERLNRWTRANVGEDYYSTCDESKNEQKDETRVVAQRASETYARISQLMLMAADKGLPSRLTEKADSNALQKLRSAESAQIESLKKRMLYGDDIKQRAEQEILSSELKTKLEELNKEESEWTLDGNPKRHFILAQGDIKQINLDDYPSSDEGVEEEAIAQIIAERMEREKQLIAQKDKEKEDKKEDFAIYLRKEEK